MRDIYDPPPVPDHDLASLETQPLQFTRSDLACLIGLCLVLFAAAVIGWRDEPELAIATALGGVLVIVESWMTALGFLAKGPRLGLKARLLIFVEALVPWLVGLAAATAVILGLFWVADRVG